MKIASNFRHTRLFIIRIYNVVSPWLSWLERTTVTLVHRKVASSSLAGDDLFVSWPSLCPFYDFTDVPTEAIAVFLGTELFRNR